MRIVCLVVLLLLRVIVSYCSLRVVEKSNGSREFCHLSSKGLIAGWRYWGGSN